MSNIFFQLFPLLLFIFCFKYHKSLCAVCSMSCHLPCGPAVEECRSLASGRPQVEAARMAATRHKQHRDFHASVTGQCYGAYTLWNKFFFWCRYWHLLNFKWDSEALRSVLNVVFCSSKLDCSLYIRMWAHELISNGPLAFDR